MISIRELERRIKRSKHIKKMKREIRSALAKYGITSKSSDSEVMIGLYQLLKDRDEIVDELSQKLDRLDGQVRGIIAREAEEIRKL